MLAVANPLRGIPPDTASTAAGMAVTQRPLDLRAFEQVPGPPAWRTIPSWFLVARRDRVISPDAERFFAGRMGAHTIEVDSAHAAMVSHPDAVVNLILRASRAA